MKSMDSLYKLLVGKLPLGTWFRVPVYLHNTWVILTLAFCLLTPKFAVTWLCVYAIVMAHEFGHIFAGRCFNQTAHSVTLFPFGGVAQMTIPKTATGEYFTAIGGPAVNVVLAIIFGLVGEPHEIFREVPAVNMALLIFNLIPAFPMDGGRVLRAMFFAFNKDRFKATKQAVIVSQAICVLMGLIGLFMWAPTVIMVSIFVFLAANQELEVVEKEELEAQSNCLKIMLNNYDSIGMNSSQRAKALELLLGAEQRLVELQKKISTEIPE